MCSLLVVGVVEACEGQVVACFGVGRVRLVLRCRCAATGLSDAEWDLVESLERCDEIACPWPGVGEAAEALTCGGDDVASGVEQAVAEPFRLSVPETSVAVVEE